MSDLSLRRLLRSLRRTPPEPEEPAQLPRANIAVEAYNGGNHTFWFTNTYPEDYFPIVVTVAVEAPAESNDLFVAQLVGPPTFEKAVIRVYTIPEGETAFELAPEGINLHLTASTDEAVFGR